MTIEVGRLRARRVSVQQLAEDLRARRAMKRARDDARAEALDYGQSADAVVAVAERIENGLPLTEGQRHVAEVAGRLACAVLKRAVSA